MGAGTGFITEGLLHKGLKVIAVDRSEEMLDQMRPKFKEFNKIEYKQGEAEKLPIDNDAVDYAMANMYLHHVDDPLVEIKEKVRILKPGGKLIVTDLDEHNHEFLRIEHHDQWMGFKRKYVEEWLLTAGLRNVMVDHAGGNCCATSNCGCSNASISVFVDYGEKVKG